MVTLKICNIITTDAAARYKLHKTEQKSKHLAILMGMSQLMGYNVNIYCIACETISFP